MKPNDSLFQQNLRELVLNQIADEHKLSERVISAMKSVPRHLFVEAYLEEKAYDDKPLPILSGQTISQITTVAIQTELLKTKAGDKILEIGTGSGYQAAILAEMECMTYSIERVEELHRFAIMNLEKAGYRDRVVLVHGDGYGGLPQFAPYDGIVVTCAAPEIPEKLIDQLTIGGRMVVPVGVGSQEMKVIEKINDTEYSIETAGYFVFVPMLKGVIKGI